MSNQSYRIDAIKAVAKRMLHYWDVIEKHNDMEGALNTSFHLGGMETFLNAIGPYWAFEYKKGLKVILWKGVYVGDFDKVSKNEFIKYAREIWNEEKQQGQLTLFK